jgi:hypothetical protein
MLLWRDFNMWKSSNEMQINPPVVFMFTRQSWRIVPPPIFYLPLAFDVWASITYFTSGSSYLFSLRQQYEYIFSVSNIF